jgi:hypothetical protein
MESYKNLYTAEEYNRLKELNEIALEQNEILKQQRDKVIEDLAKHAQTIVDLQNEKLMLLQQIERTIDEQKVDLPREVAEAIESIKADGNDIDYIIESLLAVYPSRGTNRLEIIRSFALKNGYNFISALVNGYTVELEQRDKVKQFIEKWYAVPGDVTDAELYELSDGIIDLLQKSS